MDETKEKDMYNRKWITENAKNILATYISGITVRQLHYRLVSIGMTNDIQHYKRVVQAMTEGRWKGVIDMDAFIDRERSLYGRTQAESKDVDNEIENAKEQIKAWMESYHLERWSNQDYYIEVWIEKKALQGVFEHPCNMNGVGLFPCKGYPSITAIYEASNRFQEAIANGKQIIILYFGDYDPSGEDIPRSVHANIGRLDCDIEVKRIALHPEQIAQMRLPGVPPKQTDTRTRNWNGASVVELDAVEPNTLEKMCDESVKEFFDEDKHSELRDRERIERIKYRGELKKFVNDLGSEE
jgi:hypothetical protein